MSDDINAFVHSALRDADISKLLSESPKLRKLVKRLCDEVRLLSDDDDDGSVFPVKNGANTKLLRTCDIFFFESQGRKIALRTKAQEIVFYSKFEQLTTQLPDSFLRCHRSYIVNAKKIKEVNFTSSVVTMSDGSVIPVSRTYRDSVKEALDKLGNGGVR
jgi:DNA-binding LytR/AlgR family response regulator